MTSAELSSDEWWERICRCWNKVAPNTHIQIWRWWGICVSYWLWKRKSSLKLLTSTFHSVQFSCSVCPTLCDPMNHSTPGLPVHLQLPEFTQTHVHWVHDAIQPSHPLSSLFPPALNRSQHQSLFQWVNSSHEGPKYWSFSFSIIPSKEIPGLISFRMDWFDLLAVQGTLKSLLQHHSSKASVLQCSAFLWSNSHLRAWLLEKP